MTYDFECPICNHTEEVLMWTSELHIKQVCPNCATIMERKISAPNFVIVNSGTYNPGTGSRDSLSAINSKRNAQGKSELIPCGNDMPKEVKREPKYNIQGAYEYLQGVM